MFVFGAARYTSSPVGPYLELAVAEPTRAGLLPCLRVTEMIVDSAASAEGGRANWGFPKQLGCLAWTEAGAGASMAWEDGEVQLVAERPTGVAVPLVAPVRTLQHRHDGPVVVPGRLLARAAITRLTVDAPVGSRFGEAAGTRRGLLLTGLRLVFRHPLPWRRTKAWCRSTARGNTS